MVLWLLVTMTRVEMLANKLYYVITIVVLLENDKILKKFLTFKICIYSLTRQVVIF